jgi:membrane associated rhomboid family serine protease
MARVVSRLALGALFSSLLRMIVPLTHLASSPLLALPGSIYAVMTTFACLQPRATFLLFFFIPAPAYIVVPGILAYDFYSALVRPGQPGLFLPGIVDSAGHLGGAGAGVLFWRFYLRGLRFR